jgi:hypothetical protein
MDAVTAATFLLLWFLLATWLAILTFDMARLERGFNNATVLQSLALNVALHAAMAALFVFLFL